MVSFSQARVGLRMACLLFAALFCLMALPRPAAMAAGSPMVSGSVVRDFARITFYWMEKVGFNTQLNGNRLTVRFDRPVNPDFGEILRSLHPYVQKAELSGDQRTIIFTLNQPYHIRTFITETESGIDLVGINDAPPVEVTPTAPEPVQTAQTTPPPAQPVLAPPAPARKPTAPAQPAPVRTPQPAAEPAPEPSPAPAPAPTPAPQPRVSGIAAPPIETVVEQPLPEEPAAPVPQPGSFVPANDVASPAGVITGPIMQLQLRTENEMPTLHFPWEERVASAVWTRNNTVWILFNKPVQVSGLQQLVNDSGNWLRHAEQLGGEDHTVLRLVTRKPVTPIAKKVPQEYGWNIQMSNQQTPPETVIKPTINTESQEPFLFFELAQADGPYDVIDPQVGDTLRITPLFASSTGIWPGRALVDVTLLPTAQGIALIPQADAVAVTRLRNGLRVSAPDGLFLSPDAGMALPAAQGSAAPDTIRGSEAFKPTLFPYREWLAADGTADDYMEMKAYLLYEVSTAPSPLRQNQWRKRLAELYLAEKLYSEALSVLERIRETDPVFFQNEKLAAYEGMAYLMLTRHAEAARSFNDPTLDNEPEAPLLRSAANAAQGGGPDEVAMPYLELNDAYIRQYPPDFRQRLAIIAANQAIRMEDYIAPMKVFASLEDDDMDEDIKPYITFLKGSIASEVGREDDAKRFWQELADNPADRQFRARAAYALTLLQLREGEITPQEAAETLDRLRIVWRGDDLEQNLLTVLGQLYVNLGDYWRGMKAWEELLQYFPNTPAALNAYQRLSETFVNLFMDNAANELTPLEALALYNEFQELTPLGPEGDRMLRKLVDRLVAVDLLDEAASRLENQIEYRLQGEEKSVVGARLALIYLLNREPAKALRTLQSTREENVPASLSLERNRLAAQALLEYERPERALEMIEGDYSTEGEAVRLQAYWELEDWANVVDIVELMFRNRPDRAAPFDEMEGQHLLQLAMAYIFLGEYDQLDYLRTSYSPLMEDHPLEDEFLFLTQERTAIDPEDFQQVNQTITGLKTFMDNFRAEVEEKGLSGAIEADAGGATAPAGAEAAMDAAADEIAAEEEASDE